MGDDTPKNTDHEKQVLAEEDKLLQILDNQGKEAFYDAIFDDRTFAHDSPEAEARLNLRIAESYVVDATTHKPASHLASVISDGHHVEALRETRNFIQSRPITNTQDKEAVAKHVESYLSLRPRLWVDRTRDRDDFGIA